MDLNKEAVAQQAAASRVWMPDSEVENQRVDLGWTSELASFVLSHEEAQIFAPCPMSKGPSPCPSDSLKNTRRDHRRIVPHLI